MNSQNPNAPASPQIHEGSEARPDLSSLHVREEIAITGLCGNVHLPTGRTCNTSERHGGSCNFVGPEDAENLAAH
jgi:hypothetical protein